MAFDLGIGKAIGGAVTAVAGVFTAGTARKQAREQGVHDEAMADVNRLRGMDDNDAAYAIQKIKENAGTWKDEVALITVLIPAWLAFIKVGEFDGPAIVSAGMTALGETPIWYQGLLTGAITAALGINEYAKHGKRSRLQSIQGVQRDK